VIVPTDLVAALLDGDAVLFAGAGLSASVGLPTWRKLVEDMIVWAEASGANLTAERAELANLIRQGKLTLAAETLRQRMGSQRFKEYLRAVFRDTEIGPSETHNLLTELPFSAVLTTNYDVLLETAYVKTTGIVPRVFTQVDTAELADMNREKGFYVLKLHGDIDRISSLVLGAGDYRKVMFANPAFRDSLRALFLSRTMFFVGCSLADPDLVTLLEELRTIFEGYGRRHYVLLPSNNLGNLEQQQWEDSFGIQVISYRSSPGHPEVREFLERLRQECAGRETARVIELVWDGIPHSSLIVMLRLGLAQGLLADQLLARGAKHARWYDFHFITIDLLHYGGDETVISGLVAEIDNLMPQDREIDPSRNTGEVLELIAAMKSFWKQEGAIEQFRLILIIKHAERVQELPKLRRWLRGLTQQPDLPFLKMVLLSAPMRLGPDDGFSSSWFNVFQVLRAPR
jgi:hypothetical protein